MMPFITSSSSLLLHHFFFITSSSSLLLHHFFFITSSHHFFATAEE